MPSGIHRLHARPHDLLTRTHPLNMDSLGEIIRANGGFFSRADALRCAYSDRDLMLGVRGGRLIRLRHGMYARPDEVDPADDAACHLLLARSVVASQRGAVALTGVSAALLHGFTVYGHDLETVHLVRLDRGACRRQAGVVHHVNLDGLASDLEERSGFVTTNALRTVWEVARTASLESGVCTADSAIRLRPELEPELRELGNCFLRHPHSAKARVVVRLADGRSGSAGESVTRVQFYRFGIPMPELQFEVFNRDGELVGIADFGWEYQRHLGEFDGKVKFEKFLRPGETASDCVFREKRREDAMRADLRGMTRFIWSTVMPQRARSTMAGLAYDLDQSHRLYVIGRAS